jgi:hypothetical protein
LDSFGTNNGVFYFRLLNSLSPSMSHTKWNPDSMSFLASSIVLATAE